MWFQLCVFKYHFNIYDSILEIRLESTLSVKILRTRMLPVIFRTHEGRNDERSSVGGHNFTCVFNLFIHSIVSELIVNNYDSEKRSLYNNVTENCILSHRELIPCTFISS